MKPWCCLKNGSVGHFGWKGASQCCGHCSYMGSLGVVIQWCIWEKEKRALASCSPLTSRCHAKSCACAFLLIVVSRITLVYEIQGKFLIGLWHQELSLFSLRRNSKFNKNSLYFNIFEGKRRNQIFNTFKEEKQPGREVIGYSQIRILILKNNYSNYSPMVF